MVGARGGKLSGKHWPWQLANDRDAGGEGGGGERPPWVSVLSALEVMQSASPGFSQGELSPHILSLTCC